MQQNKKTTGKRETKFHDKREEKKEKFFAIIKAEKAFLFSLYS